jgi:hypothetical protein
MGWPLRLVLHVYSSRLPILAYANDHSSNHYLLVDFPQRTSTVHKASWFNGLQRHPSVTRCTWQGVFQLRTWSQENADSGTFPKPETVIKIMVRSLKAGTRECQTF